MQPLYFSKMHGLGNDFVVINDLDNKISVDKLPIIQLSHRHIGIGFDQLLILKPSITADFGCLIFNADGSEAEQCGNGMRCVARFIDEEKLNTSKQFSIETRARIVQCLITDFDHIDIRMGIPQLIDTKSYVDEKVWIISMGNHHAILQVRDVRAISIGNLVPKIMKEIGFENGINIGFMQVIDKNTIALRTYERGVGETLACGSNACAAVFAGHWNSLLNDTVIVNFEFGKLKINCNSENGSIAMLGPASKVFSGCYISH